MHNFRLQNLKFKHLIENIVINLWSLENFASMEYTKRKCNSIVDLSKFTFNKNILSEIVVIGYNQICSQTLSFYNVTQ